MNHFSLLEVLSDLDIEALFGALLQTDASTCSVSDSHTVVRHQEPWEGDSVDSELPETPRNTNLTLPEVSALHGRSIPVAVIVTFAVGLAEDPA